MSQMTADVGEAPSEMAPLQPKRMIRRIGNGVLVAVVVVFLAGVAWAHNYNPLAQSFQNVKGEFSSYVASANGTKALSTISSVPGQPVSQQLWSEPSGTFSVEVETEIDNNGSRAVQITSIGKPDFGYKVSDYRVSFFRDQKLGSEAGANFHPFSLAGHAERMIVVDYSQSCRTSASAATSISSGTITGTGSSVIMPGMSSLPVTYSFLGFTRTDYVPVMPFALQTPQVC
jgi:hypothetical protein